MKCNPPEYRPPPSLKRLHQPWYRSNIIARDVLSRVANCRHQEVSDSVRAILFMILDGRPPDIGKVLDRLTPISPAVQLKRFIKKVGKQLHRIFPCGCD